MCGSMSMIPSSGDINVQLSATIIISWCLLLLYIIFCTYVKLLTVKLLQLSKIFQKPSHSARVYPFLYSL